MWICCVNPKEILRLCRRSLTYVQITQSIPGAQVYVFDATGTQLGNGSGSTINLNRTIVCGDILTVVQQVGDSAS
ncbi:MAG TPA: hypothetical protein VH595_08200 [Verrucomicrobiae bacterium]|nr:hypothetical protein [Verrucomicrobiae bacterium]